MPNNPVQIILNPEDFHRAPDARRPGPQKDFFAGADKAFALHKASLLQQMDDIHVEVKKSPYGPATYVRVQLRTEAIARS